MTRLSLSLALPSSAWAATTLAPFVSCCGTGQAPRMSYGVVRTTSVPTRRGAYNPPGERFIETDQDPHFQTSPFGRGIGDKLDSSSVRRHMIFNSSPRRPFVRLSLSLSLPHNHSHSFLSVGKEGWGAMLGQPSQQTEGGAMPSPQHRKTGLDSRTTR